MRERGVENLRGRRGTEEGKGIGSVDNMRDGGRGESSEYFRLTFNTLTVRGCADT